MSFEQFLVGHGLSASTRDSYAYQAGCFVHWLHEQGNPEVEYTLLLEYVKACRAAGDSERYLAAKLTAVRWWLGWQKDEGVRADNPAGCLRLKSRTHRLPHDLLDAEQLDILYQGCATDTRTDQRNKAMLGVLIHQAMTTAELGRLEPTHVDVQNGTLRVLPTKQTGGRSLQLKPFQVLELYTYQLEVRPQLLKERSTENPKLFISTGSSDKLQNTLQVLSCQLKDQYGFFTGFSQIRASVITNWLKVHPLRQVQYWAGHKYVSSTERYLLGGLESLKHSVERFHPLR